MVPEGECVASCPLIVLVDNLADVFPFSIVVLDICVESCHLLVDDFCVVGVWSFTACFSRVVKGYVVVVAEVLLFVCVPACDTFCVDVMTAVEDVDVPIKQKNFRVQFSLCFFSPDCSPLQRIFLSPSQSSSPVYRGSTVAPSGTPRRAAEDPQWDIELSA